MNAVDEHSYASFIESLAELATRNQWHKHTFHNISKNSPTKYFLQILRRVTHYRDFNLINNKPAALFTLFVTIHFRSTPHMMTNVTINGNARHMWLLLGEPFLWIWLIPQFFKIQNRNIRVNLTIFWEGCKENVIVSLFKLVRLFTLAT